MFLVCNGKIAHTGWNGVLVAINDIDALARGVEWVISQSRENWEVLSSNAYKTVESNHGEYLVSKKLWRTPRG
jgi:hypothetical protein